MAGSDGPATTADAATGSNWWYVAVVVPLLSAVMLFVGFPAVVAGLLIGVRAFVLLLFVLLLFVGLPLFVATLVLPIALYKDVEYVRSLDVDWEPDRDLFVLLAVVGIFVNLVSPVVALYYLYQRHVHVGRP